MIALTFLALVTIRAKSMKVENVARSPATSQRLAQLKIIIGKVTVVNIAIKPNK
jgi:hypothetical protein